MNQDRRLNLQEYKIFDGFLKQAQQMQGFWFDPRDFSEKTYNLMNAISPEEGVTEQEYFRVMIPFSKMVLDKAKQDGKY